MQSKAFLKEKHSFGKTQNTYTARTFVQQNTDTTRKHPAWLRAWLPLPFDELSWQVGGCPDLNIINQQDMCVPHPREHRPDSREESLPSKLCTVTEFQNLQVDNHTWRIPGPSSFYITEALGFCTGQMTWKKPI